MSTRNITKVLKQLSDTTLTSKQVKHIILHYMRDEYAPVDDKALFNDFYRCVVITKFASGTVLRGMLKALPAIIRHFYSGTHELLFYRQQREALTSLYPKSLHVAISKLKMSKLRSTELRQDYDKELERKNTNRPTRTASAVIDQIKKLAGDDTKTRKYSLLSALALATGARPNEIIMTSTFEALPDNEFKQVGLSREKEGQRHINEVIRPAIGLSADDIITLIDEYRTTWAPYIAKKKAAGKNESNIVRLILLAANKHTSSVLKLGKTMSYFRKVYANTAEATRENKDMDRMYYIGRVLGHAPGDATTAHSYSIIRIIDDLSE
jgi:hypothetical protein